MQPTISHEMNAKMSSEIPLDSKSTTTKYDFWKFIQIQTPADWVELLLPEKNHRNKIT